jgi:CelD/BcsL family acetyltransferase involved in cellulose biosynthesis
MTISADIASRLEGAEPLLRAHAFDTAVVDTDAGFHDLRNEWTELLKESTNDTFFLTWEWLYTWWKHLRGSRRLHLVIVRHDGRLVALAPLARRPRQWGRLVPFELLEFLGCGNVGSDYLSLIVRRGFESTALPALIARLRVSGYVLELSHVDRANDTMTTAAAELRSQGWQEHSTTIERCPHIGLEGHTWDSFLDTLGRTHRTNFRRKVKKLNQLYALRIDEAHTDAERRAALDVLVNLHLKRREELDGSDALHTPELVAFHEEATAIALERGWLKLYVMWLNDSPAAAMYGFEYNGVFNFYQSGFDSAFATYSVGLVMTGLSVQAAIERGIRDFDFLHGEEPYKYLWASAERELLRSHYFPPHARGKLFDRTMQLRRSTLQLLSHWRPARYGARPSTATRPNAPAWSTNGRREAGTDDAT